jgi:hypothetical protein
MLGRLRNLVRFVSSLFLTMVKIYRHICNRCGIRDNGDDVIEYVVIFAGLAFLTLLFLYRYLIQRRCRYFSVISDYNDDDGNFAMQDELVIRRFGY